MRPYSSKIKVQSPSGHHLYEATADDARWYVQRGLAVAVDDGRVYIGAVQLTLSLGALREMYGPKAPKLGRPRPTLDAQSSTGDAGRGLALVGRYRTIHTERQAALNA